MADLGYGSTIRRGALHRLRDHEIPCLFLPDRHHACVIVDREDGALTMFNGSGIQEGRPPRMKGDVIAFAPIVDAELATMPTGRPPGCSAFCGGFPGTPGWLCS